MDISSAADIRQKIEEKRYAYFTFPVLDFTIKYRKPDLLKLSFNNALPTLMAQSVIAAYRANIEGHTSEFMDELKGKPVVADDTLLHELRDKGYELLKELCVSHKILSVPQSDFENEVIAWNDIPEEDALAFLLNLLGGAQKAATLDGGEMSSGDIVTFPDGKRSRKRSSAGKGM